MSSPQVRNAVYDDEIDVQEDERTEGVLATAHDHDEQDATARTVVDPGQEHPQARSTEKPMTPTKYANCDASGRCA